jgi:hypothetical protein
MCYVLTFRPKAIELPEDRLLDRVINLLQGRVWVDAAEFEIARVDVETEGRLRLWGGLLGEVGSFRLHLERERSPLGAWFNRFAEASVRGRRLFLPFHMRMRELAGELRVTPSPVDSADSLAALASH